jgi:hypothetical protein
MSGGTGEGLAAAQVLSGNKGVRFHTNVVHLRTPVKKQDSIKH